MKALHLVSQEVSRTFFTQVLVLFYSIGTFLTKYLRTIFETPFLFDEIVEYVIERKLSEACVISLGWLVIEVIKGGEKAAIISKQNPQVRRFAKVLAMP